MFLFWHKFIFQPLFNFLLYLYQYHTAFNMGWAVVYMTVLLRLALLPFSIMTEQSKAFYRRINAKVAETQRDFADDHVKQRQEIRRLLKENKIRPWTRLVVLLFHVVILVALYQVFVGGLTGGKILENLYRGIPRPDFINTNWMCLDRLHGRWCVDIAESNLPFAALVALVLFTEITLSQRGQRGKLAQTEVVYRVLFPGFTFVALALLPSVKSLFILTSLLFSIIISLSGSLVWGAGKRKTATTARKTAQAAAQPDPLSNQLYGRHSR